MAPHLTLLIELFEAIIDQASNNAASLRNLALTCSTFLPRARYHLFSRICIQTMEQMESSRNFVDTHPWLLPLVRQVSLCIFLRIDNSTPSIRLLDVVPVHLLSRLPNLRTWKMGLKGFESGPGTVAAWLSLHRSALSCYQRYGGRIQRLELLYISFEDTSDFVRLVSAFTSIHTLTCSDIGFRRRENGGQTKSPVKPLKVTALRVDSGVDTRAVEYLLEASQPVLQNLVLTVGASEHERLETSMSRLSQLSSLTLVILSSSVLPEDHDTDSGILQDIRCATGLLKHFESIPLEDVRVEFRLDPIASLGSCLSWGGTPLEACKALGETLLTFPQSRMTFCGPFLRHRSGRAEFWTPTIKRAFATLDERDLLAFMWECDIHDCPQETGHEAPLECLVFSHDSEWVVTASRDGTIIVWDAARGAVAQQWLAHRGHVRDLALSPDSRRLVSAGGGQSETLAVWDLDHPNSVRRASLLEGHRGAITTCAWSPDGALIASASADGTLRVWDAVTFQQRGLLEDPRAICGPERLQFSPNGRHLAWMSSSPYGCGIWSPLAQHPPTWLPSHPSREGIRINALSFDLVGKRIATAHGNWDGQPDEHVVRIWDVETGAVLVVLAGHARRVVDVSFSPDGTSVLSASSDGSAKVWDAERAEERAALAHPGDTEVSRACFSPDARYAATASREKTVRVWKVGDGECVEVFEEHGDDVWHVAFSPDGELLASGDWGGVVHIRRLSSLCE